MSRLQTGTNDPNAQVSHERKMAGLSRLYQRLRQIDDVTYGFFDTDSDLLDYPNITEGCEALNDSLEDVQEKVAELHEMIQIEAQKSYRQINKRR